MTDTFTEGRHAAEFILDEANGQRSRENVTLAASQTITPGMVLIAGEAWVAASAVPGTGDDVCIAIYGVTTAAGETTTKTAVIARDAEVNGNCLEWPADATDANIATAVAVLAEKGIIVRGVPAGYVASPSP